MLLLSLSLSLSLPPPSSLLIVRSLTATNNQIQTKSLLFDRLMFIRFSTLGHSKLIEVFGELGGNVARSKRDAAGYFYSVFLLFGTKLYIRENGYFYSGTRDLK